MLVGGLRWVVLLTTAGTAAGHGLLTDPAPRAGTQQAGGNKGNNAGPCGQQTAAGNAATTVRAGEELTLNWRVGARHGGDCEISIANGAVGEPTNAQLAALGPRFNCGNAGNENRAVTIPATAAAGPAVIQWQWDGDAPYFNCMDITVQAAEGTGDTGGTNAGTDGTGGTTTGAATGKSNTPMVAGGVVAVLLLAALVYYCKCSGGGKAPPPPGGEYGYDQGGYGYDQGGYDQGGYDQGGYDQGGYDQGQGGYGYPPQPGYGGYQAGPPPPMPARPGAPPAAPRPAGRPAPLPPRRY